MLSPEFCIWVFPKIGVPQNGWFTRENPIRIDDLGGTPVFGNTHIKESQADKFFFELPSTAISRPRVALVAPPWAQGVPSDRAPAAAASEDMIHWGSCGSVEKYDEP